MSFRTMILDRARRLASTLVLLASATSAQAMPIHIGNVYPSPTDEPLSFDVAVGRNIVIRDLDYREFATVDGWPGANEVSFFRAGTTTLVASGYIVPPLFTPAAALERGYSVLITRTAGDEAPLVIVANENNPQQTSSSHVPPGFVTFASPAVDPESPTAMVSSSCEFARLNGAPAWSTSNPRLDATPGRTHLIISQVPQSPGCSIAVGLNGRRPFILGNLPPAEGRTLRVILIGDGENRQLEALALYAGVPQLSTGTTDPMQQARGDSVWIASDRPGLAYAGDDPVRTSRGAGYLLSADETGKPRWLLVVFESTGTVGSRSITVYGATRRTNEDAQASEIGTGSMRATSCNAFEIVYRVGDVATQRTYERSMARSDCTPR